VVPLASGPVQIDIAQDQSSVSFDKKPLLTTVQSLTLNPSSAPGNPNPPSTPAGTASIFLRAGVWDQNGTFERNVAPVTGQPYVVEIWVDASGTNADTAKAVVTYDPAQLQVNRVQTPPLEDIAFKSPFLWLPSLGQPDIVHIPGLNFSIPGLMLIVMTITSFVSQRMTTMPTEDPQQQAMMRSMAFMPLMYLFFFLNTPAGLVLYWLTSNIFSMFQQYFTVGMGMLAGDLVKITGRDFQPPWAHVPGQVAPIAALASDTTTNGRADSSSNHKDGRTPGSSAGATGATRRPRPGQGKGRKRGKR
jgi:hypothetical protein